MAKFGDRLRKSPDAQNTLFNCLEGSACAPFKRPETKGETGDKLFPDMGLLDGPKSNSLYIVDNETLETASRWSASKDNRYYPLYWIELQSIQTGGDFVVASIVSVSETDSCLSLGKGLDKKTPYLNMVDLSKLMHKRFRLQAFGYLEESTKLDNLIAWCASYVHCFAADLREANASYADGKCK